MSTCDNPALNSTTRAVCVVLSLGVSYLLACLPGQPKNAALGDAVPPTKLGSSCPLHVLGDQALDRLGLKPLANPPLPATA
jgi:hypothetical protein